MTSPCDSCCSSCWTPVYNFFCLNICDDQICECCIPEPKPKKTDIAENLIKLANEFFSKKSPTFRTAGYKFLLAAVNLGSSEAMYSLSNRINEYWIRDEYPCGLAKLFGMRSTLVVDLRRLSYGYMKRAADRKHEGALRVVDRLKKELDEAENGHNRVERHYQEAKREREERESARQEQIRNDPTYALLDRQTRALEGIRDGIRYT